jgi:hypothetical protein
VLVDKLTVCRGRQDAAPEVGIDVDMVGHGLGFALQRKIAQVETLRHKRVVAHEQQISGGGIDPSGRKSTSAIMGLTKFGAHSFGERECVIDDFT